MTVSLELLACGTLAAPQSQFTSGASEDRIALPIPAWLVRHAQGLVLVDCGMHPDLTEDTKYFERVSRRFTVDLTPDQLIDRQLAARDIDAADIDIVILTHLHFDHAGGLSRLPNARVIVQAAEWAAGESDEEARAQGFVTDDYRHGHDVVTVDGEHDVFGDGIISCIPTPGHTPGHQSVRIRLANQEIVLCGDCAYFESTLAGGPLPPFGDHELQHASIGLLNRMGAAGATLIPGHDAAVLKTLPDRMT